MMHTRERLVFGAALVLALAGASLAQYKVVGPDGKITYTDRPPATGQVTAVRGAKPLPGAMASSSLPQALREPVQRFPVVLYSGPNCTPCDSGRQLLAQRGVPFAEKRVESAADIAALEKLSGTRNLPQLAVGQRRLQGLVVAQWTSSLDAAGYPKASALPKGYTNPPVQPLAPAASPAKAQGDDGIQQPSPEAGQIAPTPAPRASGIRF